MPKRREVPSLQSLSIRSVVSLVLSIKSRIDLNEEPQRVDSELQRSISCLRELLYSHVPFALYDEVAVKVLEAVEKLIYESDWAEMEMNPASSPPHRLENANVIARSLPMVVLTSKLSTNLGKCFSSIHPILNHNLHRLTGLKRLNLINLEELNWTLRFQECVRNIGGFYDDNPDDYQRKCIAGMKHLEELCISDTDEFDCQFIGENCPLLQHLELSYEYQPCTMDDSIPYLLKCQNLKHLYLDLESLSSLDVAKLIAGLPKLQRIKCNVNFEDVIRHLHQQYTYCSPFGLRTITIMTDDMSKENMQLFVRLFPKLEEVSLRSLQLKYYSTNTNSKIADLMVLTPLDQLNSIRLDKYSFYSNHMKQLLEAKGGNITSLYLIDIYELDSDALIDLSQYCPKLIVLKFYKCYFQRDRPFSYKNLKVKPFQCLEKLNWNWTVTLRLPPSQLIEFVLIHAVNIRYVYVKSVTHSSIVNILAVNPMKKLEEFEVREVRNRHNMNMSTVELLLEKCENIKVLRNLRSWRGISKQEFERFKEYIKENNLDLSVI